MRGLAIGLAVVLLAGAGAQAQTNLLPNPGFETSTIGDGWMRVPGDPPGSDYSIVPWRTTFTCRNHHIGSGTSVVGGGDQHGGENAVKIESHNGGGYHTYFDTNDNDLHIPVVPGSRVRMDFWARGIDDQPGWAAGAFIRQHSVVHTTLDEELDRGVSIQVGEYRHYYVPGPDSDQYIQLEPDCHYISVNFKINDHITIWVDDISVIQPEPEVWPDADKDGDVDQTDFAMFQRCHTGGGTFTLSDLCRKFDRDKDLDVDETDYGEFEKCATGPSVLFYVDPPAGCDLGP